MEHSMRIEQLRTTAQPIAERIAQLVNGWVSILDQYGLELAMADPPHAGNGHMRREHVTPYVAMQVSLEGEPVKVLVGEPYNPQRVSKNVAQSLIALVT